jgi:hypothetical protein
LNWKMSRFSSAIGFIYCGGSSWAGICLTFLKATADSVGALGVYCFTSLDVVVVARGGLGGGPSVRFPESVCIMVA